MSNLNKLTIPQLKEKLREKNLKQSGNKPDLIKRLTQSTEKQSFFDEEAQEDGTNNSSSSEKQELQTSSSSEAEIIVSHRFV